MQPIPKVTLISTTTPFKRRHDPTLRLRVVGLLSRVGPFFPIPFAYTSKDSDPVVWGRHSREIHCRNRPGCAPWSFYTECSAQSTGHCDPNLHHYFNPCPLLSIKGKKLLVLDIHSKKLVSASKRPSFCYQPCWRQDTMPVSNGDFLAEMVCIVVYWMLRGWAGICRVYLVSSRQSRPIAC